MFRAWTLIFAVVLAGCSMDAPPVSSPNAPSPTAPPPPIVAIESPSVQIVKLMPALKTQRFSMLLDFETDTDAVFIGAHPQGRIVYDRAHTGSRSVRFDGSSTRIVVKLGSVLRGRPFPDEWTLLGLFIFSEKQSDISIGLESSTINITPRKVTLSGNRWTTALIDISSWPRGHDDPKAAPADASLVITLPAGHPPVWCDDVLMINNTEVLVGEQPVASMPTTAPTTAPSTALAEPTWKLERRGLNYVGVVPGKFNFKLLSGEASVAGWNIDEANSIRARFSSEGEVKRLTVYGDGRSFWDGQYKPMSAEARDNAAYAEEHDAPAEITIAPELGRVNRDTPGDANNDGYNEKRGAYQLIATGARLEMQFIPHTRVVMSPVLEVSGLPAGSVLVTVEGRLIENTVRLEDGTLLVMLPVLINRPTTVNLRVQ